MYGKASDDLCFIPFHSLFLIAPKADKSLSVFVAFCPQFLKVPLLKAGIVDVDLRTTVASWLGYIREDFEFLCLVPALFWVKRLEAISLFVTVRFSQMTRVPCAAIETVLGLKKPRAVVKDKQWGILQPNPCGEHYPPASLVPCVVKLLLFSKKSRLKYGEWFT